MQYMMMFQNSLHTRMFHCNTIDKCPVVYHRNLDKSVQPSIYAPRWVEIAIKEKVTKELEHMTKLGVFAPVQQATELVLAMFAAQKIMRQSSCQPIPS